MKTEKNFKAIKAFISILLWNKYSRIFSFASLFVCSWALLVNVTEMYENSLINLFSWASHGFYEICVLTALEQ